MTVGYNIVVKAPNKTREIDVYGMMSIQGLIYKVIWLFGLSPKDNKARYRITRQTPDGAGPYLPSNKSLDELKIRAGDTLVFVDKTVSD